MDQKYLQIQERFRQFLEQQDAANNDEADEYWIESENASDPLEKIRLLEQGVQEGSALCAQQLGDRYMCGNGVPKNLVLAETYLQKAADCGLPIAMLLLAQICYNSSVDKALDLLCKSAIKGNVNAYLQIGDLASKEDVLREQLEGRMMVYYQKVYNKENPDGRENQFVGWCNATGICCQQDLQKAQARWIVGKEQENFGCEFFLDMYKAGKFPVVNTGVGNDGWAEDELEGDVEERRGISKKAVVSIVIGLISMGELAGLSVIGLILGILAKKDKGGALAVIGIVLNVAVLIIMAGGF